MSAFGPKRTFCLFGCAGWPLLKSGMVHFDDGLCITGKSVIESVCDFGLTPQHDRRRTAQIRTRASNRTFLLWGAYEADQDYPAHRLLSGAADLSLRTMPQRRNDRGEVKTKEMTNDDARADRKGVVSFTASWGK